MAKTSRNIVPTNAQIILTEGREAFQGYNFTSDNVPYYRVQFDDASNPFATRSEVFMVKGVTFHNDARVVYPADRAAAIALALQLRGGFMRPSVALNACNNATAPLFTKITEDTAYYTIGQRSVTGYSRVFTLGTTPTVLDAEMKRQGIVWSTEATPVVPVTTSEDAAQVAADSTTPF